MLVETNALSGTQPPPLSSLPMPETSAPALAGHTVQTAPAVAPRGRLGSMFDALCRLVEKVGDLPALFAHSLRVGSASDGKRATSGGVAATTLARVDFDAASAELADRMDRLIRLLSTKNGSPPKESQIVSALQNVSAALVHIPDRTNQRGESMEKGDIVKKLIHSKLTYLDNATMLALASALQGRPKDSTAQDASSPATQIALAQQTLQLQKDTMGEQILMQLHAAVFEAATQSTLDCGDRLVKQYLEQAATFAGQPATEKKVAGCVATAIHEARVMLQTLHEAGLSEVHDEATLRRMAVEQVHGQLMQRSGNSLASLLRHTHSQDLAWLDLPLDAARTDSVQPAIHAAVKGEIRRRIDEFSIEAHKQWQKVFEQLGGDDERVKAGDLYRLLDNAGRAGDVLKAQSHLLRHEAPFDSMILVGRASAAQQQVVADPRMDLPSLTDAQLGGLAAKMQGSLAPTEGAQRVRAESERRLGQAEENLVQAWTDAVAILVNPCKPEVLLQRAAAITDASAEFEKKLELLAPRSSVEPGKPTPTIRSREIAEKALASIPAAEHAGLHAMLDQGILAVFLGKLQKSAMLARTQGYGEVALRADRTIDLLALIRKHVQQPGLQRSVSQAFTKLISTVRRASLQDLSQTSSSGRRTPAQDLSQSDSFGRRTSAQDLSQSDSSGRRTPAQDLSQTSSSGRRTSARDLSQLSSSGRRTSAQEISQLSSSARRTSVQDMSQSGPASLQSSSRMSSLADIARTNQALHEVSNEIFRLSIVDDTAASDASTNSGVFNETITAKMTATVERPLSDGEKEIMLVDGLALPAQYVKDARRDRHDVEGGVHYYLPQGERLLGDDVINSGNDAQMAQRTIAGFNRLADFYDGNTELAHVVLMYAHQGVAGALLGPLFNDERNNPIKLGDMPGLLMDDGRPGAQQTGLQFYKTATGSAGIDFTYEVRGGRFLQPITYMDARDEMEHQVFLDPEHSVAHIQFRVELVEDHSVNTEGAAAGRLQDRVKLSLTAPPRYSYNLVPSEFQRPYAAKDDLNDFVPSPDEPDYERGMKSVMRQDLQFFAKKKGLLPELEAWMATWKNPEMSPLAKLEHIYGLALEPATRVRAELRSIQAGDETPGGPDETPGGPDETPGGPDESGTRAQTSSTRLDELATEVKVRLDNIGATILDAFRPIGVLLARHGEDVRRVYEARRPPARRLPIENGAPPNLHEPRTNSSRQGTPDSGDTDAYRAFLDNEAAPYSKLLGQSAALQDLPTFAHAQSLYGSLVDYVGRAGLGEHAAIPPLPPGMEEELARVRSTLLALADDTHSADLLKRLPALLAEPLAGLAAEMNEHIRRDNWAGFLEGAVLIGLYKDPPKNGDSKKRS